MSNLAVKVRAIYSSFNSHTMGRWRCKWHFIFLVFCALVLFCLRQTRRLFRNLRSSTESIRLEKRWFQEFRGTLRLLTPQSISLCCSSACCTTSWNPAGMIPVKTSPSSSSLSSEKSSSPGCRSVTKLCFLSGKWRNLGLESNAHICQFRALIIIY